jgi:hypothetical protein
MSKLRIVKAERSDSYHSSLFTTKILSLPSLQNTTTMNPSDSLQHLVVGHPKIAGQMSTQPETAIFRRFGELNARNLLYLQAELAYLEKKLSEYEIADNRDPVGEKSNYAVSWYWLAHSKDDGDTKQLDIVLKIRSRLKEYSE